MPQKVIVSKKNSIFASTKNDMAKATEEDNTLNGYVISLQKLDALLKANIQKGIVRIEKTEIIGVDDKEYDL